MSGIKLYSLSDGPPTLATRMLLKALKIDYELKPIDYYKGEHLTEEYYKLSPQREMPVLDDNGFILSESNAILQYLADKYCKDDDKLYPKELQARAVVNHRLCFNQAFYYKNILMHTIAPLFLEMERTDSTLKMCTMSLDIFNEYLKRTGFKYAAANHVTIADFPLFTASMCLEAMQPTKFDMSPWPLVAKWYDTFKKENPELWQEVEPGFQELANFKLMDLSHINHPYLNIRKVPKETK